MKSAYSAKIANCELQTANGSDCCKFFLINLQDFLT